MKKKATGKGLSKKIKGYVAGGNIFNDTNVKDPNYRKYKSGFGASLGDIGLTAADAVLSPIAPDLVKASDYQTKLGATQSNRITHGLGQVANDVATGVIGAIFPAIGAAGGALTSQTQKIGGRDKAISDKQLQQEDVIGSLGKVVGSVAGSKVKSDNAAKVATDKANGIDLDTIKSVAQSTNNLGNAATSVANATTAVAPAIENIVSPTGTDYSTYDTSKFTPEQQTDWAGAKDSASKGALLKQWGMKDGGYVKKAKGGPITKGEPVAGHTTTNTEQIQAYPFYQEQDGKYYKGMLNLTPTQFGSANKNAQKFAYDSEITPEEYKSNMGTGNMMLPYHTPEYRNLLEEQQAEQNYNNKTLPENVAVFKKGGKISKTKAKIMLKENQAHGVELSKKQKGLFGLIAGGGIPRKADGGKIVGPGTGTSDSIQAKPEDGSFIVPAINSGMAEALREKYLNGKKNQIATLRKQGGVDAMLSNGEHLFTKDEVNELKMQGVNVDALAPNADDDSEVIKQDGSGQVIKQKADGGLLKKLKAQNAGMQTFDPITGELQQPANTYPDTIDPVALPVTNTTSVANKPAGSGLLSNFDVEKAASLAQLGLGLGSLIGDGKRPVDSLDPDYVAATKKAQQEANYGLSPQERAVADLNIERNRRSGVAGVLGLSGGDAGVALANIGAANREANDASNNLSTLSEQLRNQKVGTYNNMVGHKAEMSRRLFEDKLNAFGQNQQAGAQLVGAGINNLIGSKRYDKEVAFQKELQGVNKTGTPSYTPFTMNEIETQYKALPYTEQKKYGSAKAWADSQNLYYK